MTNKTMGITAKADATVILNLRVAGSSNLDTKWTVAVGGEVVCTSDNSMDDITKALRTGKQIVILENHLGLLTLVLDVVHVAPTSGNAGRFVRLIALLEVGEEDNMFLRYPVHRVKEEVIRNAYPASILNKLGGVLAGDSLKKVLDAKKPFVDTMMAFRMASFSGNYLESCILDYKGLGVQLPLIAEGKFVGETSDISKRRYLHAAKYLMDLEEHPEGMNNLENLFPHCVLKVLNKVGATGNLLDNLLEEYAVESKVDPPMLPQRK